MKERKSVDNPRILVMSTDLAGSARRCAQLTLAGWHTIQGVDPVDVFSAVRSQDIDLILLQTPLPDAVDMDLPDVLRKLSPTGYLPVVVEAADPPEQYRCRFLEHGADDIISEDTSGPEMLARMRSLLRVKELHDQLSASRAALHAALRRERRLLIKLQHDNADLRALTTTDPLTSVQNVRSCHDILEHEFKVAKRYNQPLSLLMLDVDHFKVVNDTHGHPSGDYVLKELTVILKRGVRESDVVGRIGGEEFVVLLPKANRAKTASFAQRIRKQVSARNFNVHGHDIHITVSIGSASYPEDAEITEPEMLWYFADQALLMAKESGRDNAVAVHKLGPSVRMRLRRQYMDVQLTPEGITSGPGGTTLIRADGQT